MRNYRVDHYILAVNVLPQKLRGGIIQAFVKVFGGILQGLNNTFVDTVLSTRDFLQHDTRKVYLEKRLNDLYDNFGRGISITKLSTERPFTTYQSSEGQHKYDYQISESLHAYSYQISEGLSSLNFTINLPTALGAEQDKLIATVNEYLQSGTQYNIVLF